jgi:hypothetical protein
MIEISKIHISTELESRWCFPKDEGYGISFQGKGNILEPNCDDGCTAL